MNHNLKRREGGFTLIELMLAMGFFASILIVSTVVLIQVFGIYNKGLAVQQINSLGRRLTDDITRVGTNGAAGGGVTVTTRCVKLGDNVYIWSLAGDTPGATYETGTPAQPVSFAQYLGASCPPAGSTIAAGNLVPLLGNNIRVYRTDIRQIGETGTSDMVRFQLVLGTYGGLNSPDNPKINPVGNIPYCEAGSLGNFCAFGSYDTVIYLPNQ